jgi:hypothetical protein
MAVDDSPKAMRPSLWLWLVGVPLLLLLVGVSLTVVSMRSTASGHLASAMAAADRDDPYWRLDDLLAHREQVPEAENSAPVVAKAAALLPKNWLNRFGQGTGAPSDAALAAANAYERLTTTIANIKLNHEDSAALASELKNQAESLALARTVANFRRGRHEIVIGPAVIDTLLGETQSARDVARLLDADAAIRAQSDDCDGALDSCRAIIGTARSIGDEPTLISALVRIAIDRVAMRSAGRALGQGEPSEAALTRLQALILDELAQPLLLIGMRGERAMLTELIRRLEAGEVPLSALDGNPSKPSTRGANAGRSLISFGGFIFTGQRAIALDWLNEAVAISRRPAFEQRTLWAAWQAKIVAVKRSRFGQFTAMLPLLLTPATTAASNAFFRSQAELGATAIVIAAERHRRKTGKWPAAITEIDPSVLRSPPVDPFTGKPFHMEYHDGRLVIYSIGPNGQDDHGEFDPKRWIKGGPDDMGAQAWDLSLRGQPPAPAKK